MNWTPDRMAEYKLAGELRDAWMRELDRLIAAEPASKGGRPPGGYTPPKPRDKERDRMLREARRPGSEQR